MVEDPGGQAPGGLPQQVATGRRQVGHVLVCQHHVVTRAINVPGHLGREAERGWLYWKNPRTAQPQCWYNPLPVILSQGSHLEEVAGDKRSLDVQDVGISAEGGR